MEFEEYVYKDQFMYVGPTERGRIRERERENKKTKKNKTYIYVHEVRITTRDLYIRVATQVIK